MKKLLLLFCFAFALVPVWAQKGFPHNLKDLILKVESDSVNGITSALPGEYVQNHPDSSIYYAKKLIAYGKQNNNPRILASGLNIYSFALYNKGNYPVALDMAFQSLKAIENSKYTRVLTNIYCQIGNVYKGQQNYPKALYYYQRAKQSALSSHNDIALSASYLNLAFVYKEINALDSALYYSKLAISHKNSLTRRSMGYILSTLGDEYLKLKNYKNALEQYQAAYRLDKKNVDFRDASITCISLSKYYTVTGKPDSSIYYAQQALHSAKKASYNKSVFESAALLASLYEARRQPDSGFKYLKLSTIAKDSLYNGAKSGEMENLTTNEFLRQNEIQAAQKAYQNKLKLYALIFGLLVLLIAALLQWRNSRQRKKAYILLQKQKEEIEAQKAQAIIEVALERVRSKTMAMHSSQDVADTVAVMFDELVKLGIDKNVRCGIGIIDDKKHIELWTAFTNPDGQVSLIIGSLDMTTHTLLQNLYNAWENKEDHTSYEMAGDDLIAYYHAINDAPDYPMQFDIASLPAKQFHHDFFFPEGTIFAFSPNPLMPEAIQIFKRFAGVFGLTYRRYLDLQQAEAQAHEARIEVALERVRSRTMAMQKSEELREVIQVVYDQLVQLGTQVDQAGFGMDYRESNDWNLWIADQGHEHPDLVHIPYFDTPQFNLFIEARDKGLDHFSDEMAFEEKNKFFEECFKHGRVSDEVKEFIYSRPGWFTTTVLLENVTLFITNLDGTPYSEAEIAAFMRFGKVFEQTYRRYLDLQKAESQAKEAKIEVALERVRSRTMAMQKSDELAEVIQVLYEQLYQLNFNIDSANFAMNYKEGDDLDLWISSASQQYPTKIHLPYIDHPIFNRFIEAKNNNVDLLTEIYSFDEKNAFFDHFFKNVSGVPDERKKFVFNTPGYGRSTVLLKNVALSIQNYAAQPYTDAENAALARFGMVFEQTYTRFLDLQQAEAQAREAKIEAGLERVRAKAMSMQTSEELNELIGTVFGELTKLDVVLTRCLIMIFDPETKASRWWMANSEAPSEPMNYLVQYHKHDAYASYIKAWQERILNWRYELKGKIKKTWDDFLFTNTELSLLPEPVIAGMKAPEQVILSASFNNFGCLTLVTLEPLSDEHFELLLRFAKVFDMSYTRFNDLKQAEAQAREARIEAALERVRSKTMAMHNSDDIDNTAITMFDELVKLGVETTIRCGVAIVHNIKKMELWTATSSHDGSAVLNKGYIDMTLHPLLRGAYDAWKEQETVFSYLLAGNDVADYYRILSEYADYPFQLNIDTLPERRFHNSFIFPEGTLYAFTDEPLSADATQLFKRFTGVFGLTYRRFLDLQKAEAQAREAKIEASLEKVRGKAMAMYNSEDLSTTASMVFTELRKLGLNSKRCGVALLSKNSRTAQLYVATSSKESDSLDLLGAIELAGHPSLEKQYQSWLKNENYFDILNGDDLKSYKEVIYSMLPVPYDKSDQEEYGYYLPFSEGFLFSWTAKPFSENEITILTRFKNIIDLTFRRYIELQKSEASARDAIRQASLDRVRAQIASMRSTSDLLSITPVVWNELTTLSVPFIRCGVFIVDEEREQIHSYLSTPDGKAIAAFQLGFNTDEIAKTVLANWRNKQFVTVHWNEEEFKRLSVELVSQGAVGSEEEYLTAHPPTSLDLHFFPFLQGMLYVGNITLLNGDEINLVQSLADAFSTAYARYEDFNKLEAAKKEVEQTLTGLKAAQTQLIQSEKMASLGELTAGIAHEIQNPLNFVNNFSEVNQEMIDELKEELKGGNLAEAIAIADSIRQNEEKINHHGKRADFIVKGMLQHSRTSTGEKQLTNINVLADEFIKLSYHGLRAKDKSFNAEMVSHFDPNLPKINVVQQDIGRVLLNLFNNAFYAVHQKQKTAGKDYKPEVAVTTFAENGHIAIKVKDNGIGIPDAIKDKIMQPFFTTKPTGEGTGLGLSLSYDMVVKGHGGNVDVESKEHHGSVFTITLPL
jgi:signal transduction histidine kinase